MRYKFRPAFELFDVEKDPYCLKNLYGKKRYERRAEELSDALAEWMSSCGDEGQATEMKAFEHMAKKKKKVRN